jgi:hypothetical protein
MGYIPPEAKWYVAELIDEITVEGDLRNLVHRNLTLIRADSPEEAYEEAMQQGERAQCDYENPAGQRVRIRFHGLGALNVIYDELGHGTELLYEERIGVSGEEIAAWVRPKEQLAVFRPIQSTMGPDYSSKEVVDAAEELLRKPKPDL